MSKRLNQSTEQMSEQETQGISSQAQELFDRQQEELDERRRVLDRRLLTVILCLFVLFGVAKALGTPVTVVGMSMSPTYTDGQMLVSLRTYVKKPQLGDVVVAKSEKTKQKNYIKRVEGVPGDTLVIRDGILIRNGEPVAEGFDLMEDAGEFGVMHELKENEYFLLGDNRNDSTDSRFVGVFRTDEIKLVILGSNNQTGNTKGKK